VLSPRSYNARVGLALCCPITSHVKGYPFEVPLPENLPIQGCVLADQIKSLDWRSRKAAKLVTLPAEIVEETLGRILALLDPVEW
jgi:mRNA interferase MazF